MQEYTWGISRSTLSTARQAVTSLALSSRRNLSRQGLAEGRSLHALIRNLSSNDDHDVVRRDAMIDTTATGTARSAALGLQGRSGRCRQRVECRLTLCANDRLTHAIKVLKAGPHSAALAG
jgi:hypothetical protein